MALNNERVLETVIEYLRDWRTLDAQDYRDLIDMLESVKRNLR